MLSPQVRFNIGYGCVGHRTRHGEGRRQMLMGVAGAAPVWSKVTTAWSHGGDQTKTERSVVNGRSCKV